MVKLIGVNESIYDLMVLYKKFSGRCNDFRQNKFWIFSNIFRELGILSSGFHLRTES